ncbi:peroxidase 2-like [Lolium rigidum]|uniref:peroxidase 2-like n=1 Tax=Lolium rigidum TaxID=89674 RepID=UPI001F5E1DE8|nr:peroxidase 2-like [Lolium rigidum]
MAPKLAVLAVLASLLGAVSCEFSISIYAGYGFPAPNPNLPFKLPTASPPKNPRPDLKVDYYAAKKCPQAEEIVKRFVEQATPGEKAGLIRLFFHDCFVEGCDASVLLAGPETEMTAIPNLSLRGFNIIEKAKAALEEECKGVVSCADIVAFAGRDASCSLSGGKINYDVPAGRYDGKVSRANDTFLNLPPPFGDLKLITDMFAAKGLDQTDMLVLSGAHSIGRSACGSFANSFSNRLLPDNSSTAMNRTLADQLNTTCTANSVNVPQDYKTPYALDHQYYKNVQEHNVLFTSDAVLLESTETTAKVDEFARDPFFLSDILPIGRNPWYDAFAKAMVKMGNWEVKNSTVGEIRQFCGKVNDKTY